MNGRPCNADLAGALEEYLARRRELGFRLVEEERHVRRFLEWLWSAGSPDATFTTGQALTWARGGGTLKNSYQRQRLAAIRGFSRYADATGLDVPVPEARLLRSGRDRRMPHIYTQDEVDALIAACRRVFAPALVQATMAGIIALLAVTGMRVGEALRLKAEDIDWAQSTVRIRANKHGPDRLVPMHPTTAGALARYASDPARLAAGARPDGPLFVSTRGTAYRRTTVEGHFQRIREAAGIAGQGPAPCLLDLRHSFATRQMIRAYTAGGDPAVTLGLLAIWLGHSDPSHTYWYIQAVPELLALAANRMNTTTE